MVCLLPCFIFINAPTGHKPVALGGPVVALAQQDVAVVANNHQVDRHQRGRAHHGGKVVQGQVPQGGALGAVRLRCCGQGHGCGLVFEKGVMGGWPRTGIGADVGARVSNRCCNRAQSRRPLFGLLPGLVVAVVR
jgi:hypothetical protein